MHTYVRLSFECVTLFLKCVVFMYMHIRKDFSRSNQPDAFFMAGDIQGNINIKYPLKDETLVGFFVLSSAQNCHLKKNNTLYTTLCHL